MDDPMWDVDDHIDLPLLYRTGSARPRSVPVMFKLNVSSEVQAQPSLRNAQQILAAKSILEGGTRKRHDHVKTRVKKLVQAPKAKTGKTFCQSNMLQYVAHTNHKLGKKRHREQLTCG